MSQPRPPDRVDAALEKLAPLRYLEAYECGRAEHVVTRYYIFFMNNNIILSCNQRFVSVIEDINVVRAKNQRYVLIYMFDSIPLSKGKCYLCA